MKAGFPFASKKTVTCAWHEVAFTVFRLNLLLSLAAVASAANSDAPQPAIQIGLLIPSDPTEASSLRQGAQLAIEYRNRNGDATAKLVVRGRPGQWGTDGDEAARLALEDNAAAIITPPGGTAAHHILQVAGRTRVPVVSLCPDSSVTGAGLPWAVRIVPRTDEEARAIFAGLTGARPFRWHAIVPTERGGREITRDLRTAARHTGCELKDIIELPTQDTDWSAHLSRIQEGRPDAILIWTDPLTAGKMARALRKAGFQGFMAGPGSLRSTDFLRTAEEGAENFAVAAVILNRDSESARQQFERDYRSRFSCEADVTAVMAHDAALLLTELLRRTGSERACENFPIQGITTGASGTLRFDRDGNRIVSLALLVCRKGQFAPLTTVRSSFGNSHQPAGQ